MSGALPRTLYKHLPRRYADTMIERGELMFSTLAWFQNYEDDQRGDRFEERESTFLWAGSTCLPPTATESHIRVRDADRRLAWGERPIGAQYTSGRSRPPSSVLVRERDDVSTGLRWPAPW